MWKRILAAVAAVVAVTMLVGTGQPLPAAGAPPTAGPCGRTGVPTCLYRGDSRGPTEIFRDGFAVPGSGTNENLLDHVAGWSNRNSTNRLKGTTNLVSTTEDPLFAYSWVANSLVDDGSTEWVYVIEPNARMYSADQAIDAATRSGDAALADRARSIQARYKGQGEWVHRGSIGTEQIQYAVPVKRFPGKVGVRPDWDHAVSNRAYRPGSTRPTGETLPIARATELCPGSGVRSARSCELPSGPRSGAELRAVHGDRYTGSVDGLRVTNDPEDLVADSDALLAPLHDARGVIGRFDAGRPDPAAFDEFRRDFAGAIDADLTRLNRWTADSNLGTKVVGALGKGTRAARELLPYIGLAATGYALVEDWESGDHVDLGFDSTAAVLQVAEAADPELDVILEPVLLADLGLQELVDLVVPSREVAAFEEYVRAEQDANIARWKGAAKELAVARQTLVQQAFSDGMTRVIDERLAPSFVERLRQDRVLLREMQRAASRDAVRRALRTVPSNANAATRGRAEERVHALLLDIDARFEERALARTDAIVRTARSQLQDAATRFGFEALSGSSGLAFQARFDRVAERFIRDLEERMWQDDVNSVRPPKTYLPQERPAIAALREKGRHTKMAAYRKHYSALAGWELDPTAPVLLELRIRASVRRD